MDKVGAPTGPGKIKEFRGGVADDFLFDAVLFNYNSDGNLLKREHREYISKLLVPILNRKKYHVKIFGRASRLGNAEYNRTLSLERALRVKKFMMEFGFSEAQVPGNEMRAHGEDLSTSPNLNDEFDRAVILRVGQGLKSQPIIPRITVPITIIIPKEEKKDDKVEPKPPGSTHFQVKHLGTASAAFGAVNLFWIVDLENKMETTIMVAGGSVEEGIAPITGKGQWSEFRTEKPVQLEDFDGIARFVTPAGAFTVSAGDSLLTFDNVPTAGPIRIKTGATWGVSGGSVSTGKSMMLEAPNPYKPRYTYDPITGDWELD